jgi:hypothetical protein
MKPTPSLTPADAQAAIISSLSATVIPSGFSQKTCLPAAAAFFTCAQCSHAGVAT